MYCWERTKALHALTFIGVNYVWNCLVFLTFIERYMSMSVTECVVPETGLRHIRLNYFETFTLKNVNLFFVNVTLQVSVGASSTRTVVPDLTKRPPHVPSSAGTGEPWAPPPAGVLLAGGTTAARQVSNPSNHPPQ